ncbi:hypothetical protein BO78DRAFT_413080 [Aspergillus sclerotiicarbonarius CBS 121057]|uniref:Uncharacterized protein n=1 Tax=Aspergillus sclerotiicarbonarius (strain CBS 121057 / IBT 28362) TaxID=1448318 RepID=A0A319F7A0_ASPSB|nr:hypothetical protein BO78DRAFT_413080 [Aspergillus sclerotiicarbonarius CBS 121057]
MLSGTIFSNVWHDIASPITLLKGHPFITKERFMDALVPDETSTSDISEPYATYLQRLCLAFVVARPSRTISLPGVLQQDATFHLDGDTWIKVQEATGKFVRARMKLLQDRENLARGKQGVSSSKSPLGHAVAAQLLAAQSLRTASSRKCPHPYTRCLSEEAAWRCTDGGL